MIVVHLWLRDRRNSGGGTQTHAFFYENPAKYKPYTKPRFCIKLFEVSNDSQILSQIFSAITFCLIGKQKYK